MNKKENGRKNMLGVRLNGDEKNRLKYISKENNESPSETIRRLIEEECNRVNKKYE